MKKIIVKVCGCKYEITFLKKCYDFRFYVKMPNPSKNNKRHNIHTIFHINTRSGSHTINDLAGYDLVFETLMCQLSHSVRIDQLL